MLQSAPSTEDGSLDDDDMMEEEEAARDPCLDFKGMKKQGLFQDKLHTHN